MPPDIPPEPQHQLQKYPERLHSVPEVDRTKTNQQAAKLIAHARTSMRPEL